MPVLHLPLSKSASAAVVAIAEAKGITPAQWAFGHIATLIRTNILAYHRLQVYETFEYSGGKFEFASIPRFPIEDGDGEISLNLDEKVLDDLSNTATIVAAVNTACGNTPSWKTGREWIGIYLSDKAVDDLNAVAAKRLADNETRIEPVSPS